MSDANRTRDAVPLVAADDGFFFGLGAFETIALAAGRPLLLDAHLTRLRRTCA